MYSVTTYEPSNKNKRMVLAYLIMGHNISEALELSEIAEGTFWNWCSQDSEFNYWCHEGLPLLREHRQDIIVGMNHIKITQMLHADDYKTMKAIMLIPYDQRSAAEINQLKELRKLYASPANLKIMRDFVAPPEERKSIEDLFKSFEKNNKAIEGECHEVSKVRTPTEKG